MSTATMRRISSRSTFFNKRVFPAVWFGFLALFSIAAASSMIANGEMRIELILVPLGMAIFGYFLMKHLVLDLVDEVWDAGEELIVKNKNQEARIPLAAIMNVSYMNANPPRVTLMLRGPTRFGKEITFSPVTKGFNPFAKPPIVQELIERIEAKRGG